MIGGIELMENEPLFTVEDAVEKVDKHSSADVNYTALKQCYEDLLNRCNQLVGGFIRRGGGGGGAESC